jgi:prepilin-type N-terminal cleavage/methylation domain-containing protein
MRSIRNTKGFTLIELMIVVVIIGILAALAIPKFNNASARAKEREADGILKQIYTLQMTYYAQNGTYAASSSALETVGWQAPTVTSLTLQKKTGMTGYEDRCINAEGVIANAGGC